jgi:hypothetical protein
MDTIQLQSLKAALRCFPNSFGRQTLVAKSSTPPITHMPTSVPLLKSQVENANQLIRTTGAGGGLAGIA